MTHPASKSTGERRHPPVAHYAVKSFWKTVGPSCRCIGVLSDAVSSVSHTAFFNNPQRRALRARSGQAVAHSRLAHRVLKETFLTAESGRQNTLLTSRTRRARKKTRAFSTPLNARSHHSHARSNRSRCMTLVQAATKSCTNFFSASALA